ncbi:hypothetical protein AMTR_s00029p00040430 [Amborella trichopoda]|uniref:Uncharacterized protein n=1 Tax=Amborella trichopoda TaxID=13333 RepID=W1PNU1_AMBTC|nr:hypothetical protein AMTR_s00029p00040430 [Amborella trichopoda]
MNSKTRCSFSVILGMTITSEKTGVHFSGVLAMTITSLFLTCSRYVNKAEESDLIGFGVKEK